MARGVVEVRAATHLVELVSQASVVASMVLIQPVADVVVLAGVIDWGVLTVLHPSPVVTSAVVGVVGSAHVVPTAGCRVGVVGGLVLAEPVVAPAHALVSIPVRIIEA